MDSMIELKAADGHKLAAYRAEPSGKPRGAVVVIHEIFGVNKHIKSVANGYAADGYLVIAPSMFDRMQCGYDAGYTPPEIEAGRTLTQKADWKEVMQDAAAAVEAAKTGGKVGIVGYCWGGTVTWVATARLSGLACAVSYYGGGILDFIGEKPKCPTMCNFGELDQTPSLEQAKAIAKAHPEITAHYYPGSGHGFNCDLRGSYNAEASKLARERTLEFFRKHLG